jgi:hypothetical protein
MFSKAIPQKHVDIERMPSDGDSAGKEGHVSLKTNKDGIILVPQPSDDPEDPLVCIHPHSKSQMNND